MPSGRLSPGTQSQGDCPDRMGKDDDETHGEVPKDSHTSVPVGFQHHHT